MTVLKQYTGGSWQTIVVGKQGPTGAAGTNGTNGDWSTAQTLNSQSTNYTLAATDVGKLIVFTGGSATNCTIGTAVALSAGQRVDVLQTGAGQVTFVASSTTVNGTPGLKLRAQYSAATVLCTAANTYVVLGDLSA